MTTKPAEPSTRREVRRGRFLGMEKGFDIRVDGALAYAVRLIPSNRPLGAYPDSNRAFSKVLDEIDAGRHERTLALDVCLPGDRRDLMAAGARLERLARSALVRPRRA